MATVQIDGLKICFYLMSTEANLSGALLRRTNRPAIYDHGESEVSIVKIDPAGLGCRVIRLLHLLTEMSTDAIHSTMGPIQDCHHHHHHHRHIFHGVWPLVDPFRSHVSRSLFKGLP